MQHPHLTLTLTLTQAVVESDVGMWDKADEGGTVTNTSTPTTAGGMLVPSRARLWQALAGLDGQDRLRVLNAAYRKLARLYSMEASLAALGQLQIAEHRTVPVLRIAAALTFAAEKRVNTASIEGAAAGLAATCTSSNADAVVYTEVALRALAGKLLSLPAAGSMDAANTAGGLVRVQPQLSPKHTSSRCTVMEEGAVLEFSEQGTALLTQQLDHAGACFLDVTCAGNQQLLVGLATATFPYEKKYVGDAFNGWGYHGNGGLKVAGSGALVGPQPYKQGDTVRVE
jgi:hypothetical protein